MNDASKPADESAEDPLWQFLAQFGIHPTPGQPLDLAALMQQMGQNFPAGGGPGFGFGRGSVIDPGSAASWTQLKDQARQMSAALGPDPSPTAQQARELADAARLADLWLDEACEFASVEAAPQVWSRAQWIEASMPSWRQIVEPIMSSMATALGGLLDAEPDLDTSDLLGQLAGALKPMMRQMAGTMYGAQFSQALAKLSYEIVSGCDMGIQVLPRAQVVMLMSNIERQFGDLDGVSSADLLLHLTLRETARQRLFDRVAWLAPQMLAMIEHYAREIRIDTSAVESVFDPDEMTDFDPAKLTEMAESLQGKLFEPTRTPEQLEVLVRLETLVALVEGWVDEVTARAASRWMPNHGALTELIRRRRGVGGPTENVFSALVGLQLRPRRVREAATVWAAMTSQQGPAARDALWHHPDLLPTTADLSDPMGFVARQDAGPAPDALDAEIAALLEAEGRRDQE